MTFKDSVKSLSSALAPGALAPGGAGRERSPGGQRSTPPRLAAASLSSAFPSALPHALVHLLTVSKRSGAFFSTSWTRALCFATTYRGQEEPVYEGIRGPADVKCDEIMVGQSG